MLSRLDQLKARGRIARDASTGGKGKRSNESGSGRRGELDNYTFGSYGLTGRQYAFVMEYVSDPSSQTAAAVRAGYSPRTAEATASRLLSRTNVSAAVTNMQVALRANTEVTAEQIINRLGVIAFDPRPKPRSADQVKALELLSKWLGLETNDFQGRVELVVSFGDGRQLDRLGDVVDVEDAEVVEDLE